MNYKNIKLILFFLVHADINSSASLELSLEDLFNNSTIVPFRYKETEKLVTIRIIPQGPFYITFSTSKLISTGSIILGFNKNHLKYKKYGNTENERVLKETFFYEDINDFTINVKNNEIKFQNLDSLKSSSFNGNFTDFIFMGFSSYNPAKWTVHEGNHGNINL